MNEQNEYNLIHNYVKNGGNIHALCIKLKCSKRTIQRKVAGYRAEGKSFFLHGNRGTPSPFAIPNHVKEQILDIYHHPVYEGANFTHFHELLGRLHPEVPAISLSSLRNIFKEAEIISPKATRDTKKEHRKWRKEKEKQVHVTATSPLRPQQIIPLEKEPHPTREKSRYAGELVFMDASPHAWFGRHFPVSSLHAGIDDATGDVIGAYMEEQETLNGYYQVSAQMLRDYGIPCRIQTDKRSVFEYSTLKKPKTEKDAATQFGYACKTLGIDLRTTSCAQHQGKIERLFNTFQSRLVVELQVAGINTIEGANKFLRSYLPQYNQQFAVPLDEYTLSAWERKPSPEEINLTLAVLSSRVVDPGSCIRYMNHTYRFLDDESRLIPLKRKSPVTVIKALDGKLYAACKESIFALQEVLPNQLYSKELDPISQAPPQAVKLYIPPMSHPWNAGVFRAYEKQRWKEIYSFEELCYTTEHVYESSMYDL